MPRFSESATRLLQHLPLTLSMFMNAALLAALLYVVLPLLDVSFDKSRLQAKMKEISEITDADVFNLWQVHVAANDRHYVSSIVRDPADDKVVTEFGTSASVLPFSKVITPAGVSMLLGGNAACEDIHDVQATAQVTQLLRTRLDARHVCFVPIKNARNELTGYLAMIWKTDQTSDHLLAQVTLARGVLQRPLQPWPFFNGANHR